ncbi:TetR/AcrR family transcriptional regulator [Sphingomonas sp.]|uniref:TetR/AcrR family transcriptional regulator n=1 Tax=Sphingomonas sp. TaxID=28214 RepID=UPI003D6C9F5B
MARTQAADYDQRRETIMKTAAELYAKRGFLGASVAQIAIACKTSKSLIYHYYPSKEDILYDVMDSHVQGLTQAARDIIDGPGDAPTKIRTIAHALMDLYAEAQSNQKVLLNELGNLPVERRSVIVAHQRALLDLVDQLLIELRPDLSSAKSHRRALVMMFFGMLNWTHTWFDPSGPVKGAEIADMAADMFLAGLDRNTSATAIS